MSFTIVDIETTGLSKYKDKITEIAAVKYRDGNVIDQFQTLVNPQIPIPSFITKLTGICNELVKGAPLIDEALLNFVSFLGDDILVAHNATFDYGFLAHHLQECHQYQLVNTRLCTRKLANRLYPHLPRKRLQDLCELFEVENVQAHRALADAHATSQVFSYMLKELATYGLCEHKHIIAFENASKSTVVNLKKNIH